MIKQVLLRGISRNPSDRMTADGGCEESMNVYVDNKEVAPVTAPKDVTGDYYDQGGSQVLSQRPYYIHGENLILLQLYGSGNIDMYVVRNKQQVQSLTLENGQGGTKIVSVNSSGNILIISTDKNTWYLLYKDNRYSNLGNRVPMPLIQFYDEPAELYTGRDYYFSRNLEIPISGNTGDWDDLADLDWIDSRTQLAKSEVTQSAITQILSFIKKNAGITHAGQLSVPIMLRYAVRLIDGSVVHECSVPVLLGTWQKDIMKIYLQKRGSGSSRSVFVDVFYYLQYAVRMQIMESIDDAWKDLISSIDIYQSDLIIPFRDGQKLRMEDMSGRYAGQLFDKRLIIDTESVDDKSPAVIDEVSNFYLVKRYTFDEFNAAAQSAAGEVELAPYMKTGDALYLKEELKESGYYNSHQMISAKNIEYNGRSFFYGMSRLLSRGYRMFSGVSTMSAGAYDDWQHYVWKYAFKYRIISDKGNAYLVKGEYQDGTSWFKVNDVQEQHDWRYPYSYIAYPDPRCRGLYVTQDKSWSSNDGSVKTISVPMREHPHFGFSYCFLGWGVTLDEYVDAMQNVTIGNNENRLEEVSDRVYGTQTDNPFSFLPSTVRKIGAGAITALATTTKALSEGQFGQFPLYAFTTDGIWALTINAEGNIGSAPNPATRDVAIEGTVTPIDHAIVFTTEKGVMLLTGSDVQCLSQQMNGPQEIIPTAIVQGLPEAFAPLAPALADTDSFMKFMQAAKCAYDYIGQRLVFYNSEKPYQYVYYLASQTWHRLMFKPTANQTFKVMDALNSYPESHAVVTIGSNYHIYDLAMHHNVALANLDTLPQVVVTRPLAFGEEDVRKVLKRIKMRGIFNRGDVHYILLGSMDCIHWQRMTSLHGGSYKWFKMIIISTLAAAERLSWIDAEYESRYANKMR